MKLEFQSSRLWEGTKVVCESCSQILSVMHAINGYISECSLMLRASRLFLWLAGNSICGSGSGIWSERCWNFLSRAIKRTSRTHARISHVHDGIQDGGSKQLKGGGGEKELRSSVGGIEHRVSSIDDGRAAGRKWVGMWQPSPVHQMHVVPILMCS